MGATVERTTIQTQFVNGVGFNDKEPIGKGAALTAAHATLTQAGTDSGDTAIQAVTNSSPFGFANAAEGEAVIACVRNLMVRVGELEARLQAAGLIT